MSGVRSGKRVTVINSMVRLTSGQTASEGTGQAGLPFPVMSIPTKGEARAKTLRGEEQTQHVGDNPKTHFTVCGELIL